MLASDGPHIIPITIPETWIKKRLLYLKILLYSAIFRISWKANKSIYSADYFNDFRQFNSSETNVNNRNYLNNNHTNFKNSDNNHLNNNILNNNNANFMNSNSIHLNNNNNHTHQFKYTSHSNSSLYTNIDVSKLVIITCESVTPFLSNS